MNSCWGLQITITVTENAVIGLAVGTGLHLAALPFPQLVDLPQKVKFDMYNKGCLIATSTIPGGYYCAPTFFYNSKDFNCIGALFLRLEEEY